MNTPINTLLTESTRLSAFLSISATTLCFKYLIIFHLCSSPPSDFASLNMITPALPGKPPALADILQTPCCSCTIFLNPWCQFTPPCLLNHSIALLHLIHPLTDWAVITCLLEAVLSSPHSLAQIRWLWDVNIAAFVTERASAVGAFMEVGRGCCRTLHRQDERVSQIDVG